MSRRRRRGFALAFTRLTRYANHRVFDFPIFFFTCLFFPFLLPQAIVRFIDFARNPLIICSRSNATRNARDDKILGGMGFHSFTIVLRCNDVVRAHGDAVRTMRRF